MVLLGDVFCLGGKIMDAKLNDACLKLKTELKVFAVSLASEGKPTQIQMENLNYAKRELETVCPQSPFLEIDCSNMNSGILLKWTKTLWVEVGKC
jgi:hypothetical protein